MEEIACDMRQQTDNIKNMEITENRIIDKEL